MEMSAAEMAAWEQRAAEMSASPPRGGPEVEPVRVLPQPPPMVITGAFVLTTFHGLPPDDAYCRGMDIKAPRGPKTKEEFTFSDEVPLLRVVGAGFESTGNAFKTLGEVMDHALRNRLGLSVSDLVVPYVKVTKCEANQLAVVSPSKMHALDTPVQICYEADKSANVQLEIFLPAVPLHKARVAAAAARMETFKDRAAALYGKRVPDYKLAVLIGHGQSTIFTTALGPTCPKDSQCALTHGIQHSNASLAPGESADWPHVAVRLRAGRCATPRR